MYIERVEIEGGFLDQLDLNLKPGLNVLIGARGTGKTSLLELIRFCLGAPAFTERARIQASQQAMAVLGDGRVTIYLRSGQDLITVSRVASDAAPRADGAYPQITVVAQNEIEIVGALADGRLKLLDSFVSDSNRVIESHQVGAELSSQTAEIRGLLDTIANFSSQLTELAEVPLLLSTVMKEQQSLLDSIQASQTDRDHLQRLQETSAQLSVRLSFFIRTKAALESGGSTLRSAQFSMPEIESWPSAAGGQDPLADIRQQVAGSLKLLGSLIDGLAASLDIVVQLEVSTNQEQLKNEESARPFRRRLETLQIGAGALAQRVEALKEKQGQLSSLTETLTSLKGRVQKLILSRRETFERLEAGRTLRLQRRQEAAAELNDELKPAIRIGVTGSGTIDAYVGAIIEALQGRGLHYNTIAPVVARKMSPLEFVEAIETDDAQGISSSTGLALDRAGAICSYLSAARLSGIVTSDIDDSVSISLLDGADFKDTGELSIGQRCTVVLPILLSRHGDVLSIDQPEDHLDNAFITNTLVPALLRRRSDDQIILASHNANIPVLGEADHLILLESDGKRGFVRHLGSLDDPKTVDAVTNVMEGGKEAFRRRAAFYEGVYARRDG